MPDFHHSLRQKVDQWYKIQANEQIVDWISHGVKLPFVPDCNIGNFEQHNRTFSKHEHDFIDEEVQSLLATGAIRKVVNKPQCVSGLNVVPKKGDKLRLVIDLRRVNIFIDTPYFKNEGIEVASQYINHKDVCVSFDLKNGYHHIPVHPEYQTYLGFKWNDEFYVWQVFPFGLSCSGYYFNKTVRCVVKYLRQCGCKITFFVDDGLLTATTSAITDHTDLVKHALEDLGFHINYEKCQLVPSEKIQWIGYIIDTIGEDGIPWVYIPQARIRKLRHDIRRAIQTGSVKARQLARIAGQCISMCKAVLPGKLQLRSIYKVLGQRSSWQDVLTLDTYSVQDLTWWLEALSSWNGAPLLHNSIEAQIETDASGYGWGAWLDGDCAAGVWDSYTSHQPSNYRELLAIILALRAFAPQVSNKRVQILTDNISCVAYINHLGGPSTQLTRLARSLWTTAYELGIDLSAKHLAGKLNVRADYLSRAVCPQEWMIHPELFRYIDNHFGPHTIDRFASFRTAQLPRYNSRLYDPATEAVDAMAQHWGHENNFVNAPFSMLPRILDKIVAEQAEVTIIAPAWPAQVWYQKLQHMTTHMPIELRNDPQTILRMGVKPEPLKNRLLKLYAWKVCGANI